MKTRTGGAVPIMNQYDMCQLVQKWFLVCWDVLNHVFDLRDGQIYITTQVTGVSRSESKTYHIAIFLNADLMQSDFLIYAY